MSRPRPARVRGLAQVLGALLSYALAVPPVQGAAPAGVAEAGLAGTLGRIVVRGLVEVEEPFVRLTLQSRRGDRVDPTIVEAERGRLLGTGLFRRVEARLEPRDDGTLRLVLTLAEAPSVREVRVQGATRVPAEVIAERVRQRVDRMPDAAATDELRREVEALYLGAGFFACGLHPTRPFQLGEDGVLVVRVVEPRLVAVDVVGLRRVPVRQVRRRLALPTGKVLRASDLAASARRLADLGTLRTTRFEVGELDGDAAQLRLRLLVEEDPFSGDLELGARYEQVQGAVAVVGLVRRNLFGSGLTLGIDTELGARQSYAARLQADSLLSLPVLATAQFHSLETLREQRAGSQILGRFDERRTGHRFEVQRDLPRHRRWNLSVSDERVTAKGHDGGVLPPALRPLGSDPFRVEYVRQGVGLQYHQGPTVEPLSIEQRRALRLDLDLAGGPLFRSPGDYLQLVAEAKALRRLRPDLDVAVRARAGAIDLRRGVLPLLESLTLGGSEDHRGLGFKEQTGDRLALVNLELRRRLNPKLDLVGFVDWGDAWDAGRGFDPETSLGLGVRVDVKLFRLRLDVAHALDREGVRVSFGVGHLF